MLARGLVDAPQIGLAQGEIAAQALFSSGVATGTHDERHGPARQFVHHVRPLTPSSSSGQSLARSHSRRSGVSSSVRLNSSLPG